MRCRTLQPQIIPGVLPAGRIGWHYGEGVQDDREIERRRLGVEWLQGRVVEWQANRRINHHSPRPARFAPAPQLGKASLDIAPADKDYAPEPRRIGAAIILHPSVIGAVHRHFERDVVAGGPGAEPA